MRSVEDVVGRMLKTLVHTPITGVGHNFAFQDVAPRSAALSAFTAANSDLTVPDGWRASASSVSLTLKSDDKNVYINIGRTFDAGQVTVRFNFHHPVSSSTEALGVLEGQNNYPRMFSNFGLANRLVDRKLGEEKIGEN